GQRRKLPAPFADETGEDTRPIFWRSPKPWLVRVQAHLPESLGRQAERGRDFRRREPKRVHRFGELHSFPLLYTNILTLPFCTYIYVPAGRKTRRRDGPPARDPRHDAPTSPTEAGAPNLPRRPVSVKKERVEAWKTR